MFSDMYHGGLAESAELALVLVISVLNDISCDHHLHIQLMMGTANSYHHTTAPAHLNPLPTPTHFSPL